VSSAPEKVPGTFSPSGPVSTSGPFSPSGPNAKRPEGLPHAGQGWAVRAVGLGRLFGAAGAAGVARAAEAAGAAATVVAARRPVPPDGSSGLAPKIFAELSAHFGSPGAS
jgi:hypothetical protein